MEQNIEKFLERATYFSKPLPDTEKLIVIKKKKQTHIAHQIR